MGMRPRLHVTNGDVAAGTLKQLLPDDDVLPWRDPMVEGPFPAGLDPAATSRLRAAHLAGPNLDHDQVLRDFCLRDEHLAAASRYREITLWFEHDLLDQLQILQILDRLAGAHLAGTRLSMICINSFPGVEPFRGLGQLEPAQMATLLDKVSAVTAPQLDLARDGWAAFRSPDPRDIETFLTRDLRSLPYLRAALDRHLQEFPSTSNGLGRTDRQLMQLVSEGVARPGRLFADNTALETTLFLGDWSVYRHIQDLCSARQPLLSASPYGAFRGPLDPDLSTEDFRKQELSLTECGRRVLANQADASEFRDIDCWLGGVHLAQGKPSWRWNESAGRLQGAER
jgi:hypothetical protein